MSDRRMLRKLFSLLLLCGALFGAVLGAAGVAHAEDGFLDPDVAFKFSSSEVPGEVVVQYGIANGYYMYRERFAFAVQKGQATLGPPQLPTGIIKYDDVFAKNVEIYRQQITVRIPVAAANGPFDLAVTSQGCSDQGICYPPAVHVIHVSGAALKAANQSLIPSANSPAQPFVLQGVTTGSTVSVGGVSSGATSTAADADTAQGVDRFYSQQYAQSVLEGRGLLPVLGIFFVLGLALSLLPCSLPMIPILSSIILGEGTRLTRRRGFLLSLTYVLGMALIYTLFGVLAGLLGQSLGAWLQNPWMLGAFGLLLTVFALSQLGFFEIQLPQAWQNRVNGVSQRQAGGRFAAVFLMGALSALVVGACMTAPLFGVLAFIAQSGDVVFGAAALFVMALGIGVPLLIVGIGAGTLLPRAGAWMDGVKRVFGMLLLAVALWLVAPVLPVALTLLLAALWFLLAAVGLRVFDGIISSGSSRADAWRYLSKAVGIGCLMLATVLVVGAAAGSRDPFQPLAVFSGGGGGSSAAKDAAPVFAKVSSLDQLGEATRTAGRPSMLFFHAEWCVSCKEMEKFVFPDARVRTRFGNLNLLEADVTANNADDVALMKKFGLFGPPAAIFFDAHGNEVKALRVIGYQPVDTFLRSLDRALATVGVAAGAAVNPSAG